jgi:hypothetical protein
MRTDTSVQDQDGLLEQLAMDSEHAQQGEQDMPDPHVLLKKLPLGVDTLVDENGMNAKQNQVPICASTVWDTAVQELLDDKSPLDVIWDEEPIHELPRCDQTVLRLEPAQDGNLRESLQQQVFEQETHNFALQTYQPNSQSRTGIQLGGVIFSCKPDGAQLLGSDYLDCWHAIEIFQEVCCGSCHHSNGCSWFDTSLGEINELESKVDPSGRMQWGPGISTAIAWGQAVFRGTGNVTTQGWPSRSPAYLAHVLKSQPKEAHGLDYIAAPMRSHQQKRIFRIKSGFIPFLRRSSRRTIPASRRPSSRRRHPVRELTSRWWLTGSYGPLQQAAQRIFTGAICFLTRLQCVSSGIDNLGIAFGFSCSDFYCGRIIQAER